MRILYVVYWGALEPLGQSLVLPSVLLLAERGVEITLVTFEKESDLSRTELLEKVSGQLKSAGVKWVPLRYHKRPRIPATLFDIARGVGRTLRLRLSGKFDIVHGRTFIGGLIGLLAARTIGARFIYHNEGFYPDEQVDAGVWVEGSAPHRAARWLERRMYLSARGIVALSKRARVLIEETVGTNGRSPQVIVVPSCVDDEHFRPSKTEAKSGLHFVYSGGVGGRYLLDKVARFVSMASREYAGVHLSVFTRSDRALVKAMLQEGQLADEQWSMESVPFSEMPVKLETGRVGLLFWPKGLSEHGTSPTKVGEYWAMGLPVVTTGNVSDVDEIIRKERVGVVVQGHSDVEYSIALKELMELLADPDLWNRCRQAAQSHYSLQFAVRDQLQLYAHVGNEQLLPESLST